MWSLVLLTGKNRTQFLTMFTESLETGGCILCFIELNQGISQMKDSPYVMIEWVQISPRLKKIVQDC